MSSFVTLSIVDSRDATARAQMQRPRDASGGVGHESWAIAARDIDALASAFYADAPTRAEIAAWQSAYAEPHFWWFLERDFSPARADVEYPSQD
jgi:hypothetical protein